MVMNFLENCGIKYFYGKNLNRMQFWVQFFIIECQIISK